MGDIPPVFFRMIINLLGFWFVITLSSLVYECGLCTLYLCYCFHFTFVFEVVKFLGLVGNGLATVHCASLRGQNCGPHVKICGILTHRVLQRTGAVPY